MHVTITIDTQGPAFHYPDNPEFDADTTRDEVRRILEEFLTEQLTASLFETGCRSLIYDEDGRPVGAITIA